MHFLDGPEGQRRHAEFMAAHVPRMDQLRKRVPFEVVGLDTPALVPVRLGDSRWCEIGWYRLELIHGNWRSPGERSVNVYSERPLRTARFRGGWMTTGKQSLTEALANARTHQDLPEPARERRSERVQLSLDGHDIDAEILRADRLWAAQLTLPGESSNETGVIVIVVSNGVPPSDIRLRRMQDLKPFIDGSNEWMGDPGGS
jgi:hypothetical protein